ncbi:uncharacterized protein V2V93DRAFT_318063, partial [Kockiozyma suomiensis]|uniref:uncharacterized protein n=1 Tax=Kockiozyma suomiensis TaxID=1337062 RepID=UPI00334357B7
ARYVPGCISPASKLTDEGVIIISMSSGNGTYVTTAWTKDLGDAHGNISSPIRHLHLVLNFILILKRQIIFSGYRYKIFATLVEDEVVMSIWVEPDGTGIS